jgi:formylglycine-generating enzyme required for sulfatase activity
MMGSTDEQVAAALKMAVEQNADPTCMERIQQSEQPQHRVVITRQLLMGSTEVTTGQFKKFAAATGYKTEAEKADLDSNGTTYLSPGYAVTDDLPAIAISWNDAIAYCKWLSDVEKVGIGCRAKPSGNTPVARAQRQYSFGDDHTKFDQFGWYKEERRRQAASGWHETAEPIRSARYARQCLRVVPGRLHGEVVRAESERRPKLPGSKPPFRGPRGRILGPLLLQP